MARALTVPMPFPTPFYAPLVAGVALGHFAEEGLDVTVAPAAAYPRGTMQALLDGEIEICLGGLMRSFELADRTGQVVTHFAEVCSRSGFFLLARRPMPRFTFQDLIGKTVIGFAEAPTPWQCLLTVLRRASVDPARTTVTLLGRGAVVGELVRMLGADDTDAAARRHAKELLKAA